MAQTRAIWSSDLLKGFKVDKNNFPLGGSIDDITPFQMLSIEEKDADWIKGVADFYEVASWSNVERKAAGIQRNYLMRNNEIDPADYIINPNYNDYWQAVNFLMPQERRSPIQLFYPIAPNFVDILRGELLKRDNTWTIEAIDDQSKAEIFQAKDEAFKKVMYEYAMFEKQQQLAQMGIGEGMAAEEIEAQMQAFDKRFQEVEMQAKDFRTTGQLWANKVLKIHEKRYNLNEMEPDAFEHGLICDREFWHIDLLDDDFRVELLNPKWCDYHKGPNVKYVSQGDYFAWFDFMSAGDILNKYGRRMTEEDQLKLKDIYVKTHNLIVPDSEKVKQGAYYDISKTYEQATSLDPNMNNAMLGKELAYNFSRSPNFDHNIDVDILNPTWGRRITGHPQMFRVMRLYWRSLRRIGWLSRVGRDGKRELPEWVDENFRKTVEPEYDQSIKKEKTKDNLVYGEHVDWQWVPEWRHVMKISPNQKHTFWLSTNNTLESIYVDGAPVKFQFKGRNNPFESLPPVEGCEYSWINTRPSSFIDRIKPFQIIYNICMNQVPKKFLKDKGNKIAIDKRIIPQNNLANSTSSIDPIEDFENTLDESDILAYTLSKETLEGMGNPALPQVLPLSTVQEAQMYFTLAQQIKIEAGEIAGISRQRQSKLMASDTATSVNQGITYSEIQTEKYYEQHYKLMERVRQRMLDAAQFYTTFNETTRDVYQNEAMENVFLEIEGMDNLLPHYNLYLTSTANVRSKLKIINEFLREENTLDIQPSKKISALAEQSLPKLMSLIREGELEAQQRIEEQRAHEQEMLDKQLQAQAAEKQAERDYQTERDDKMIQKDIDVASIRALGGIQTDVDADAQLDAQENLDNYFRQQEINDARQANRDSQNAKRQTDIDQMMVDREKAAMDLEGKKYQADKSLEVAKENRTAAEMKKKQTAKKKKK